MNKSDVCFVGEGRKMQGLFKGSILAFLLIIILVLVPSMSEAQLFLNKNVTSRVNVTNAGPEVLNVTVSNPVTLVAGSFKEIQCNASIRDWNGANDINVVNATFYYFQNQSNDPDDYNFHYTNTSCTEGTTNGFYANYTCTTFLNYFANNGTWFCNVTANDSRNYRSYLNKSFTVNALYAVNVTDVIDYGNLSVTDYSENITALITNFGNMNINVSVLGYGLTQNDGLGFVCAQGSNISVENQRFSSSVGDDWAAKTPLAATNKDLSLTLAQQQNDVVLVTANTYWQLYVPPNPFGLCTGTVRFTATLP
ncbi:MAG: hypothetical protein ACP5N2_06180 [Candidatus Nanoarchaeia archaeon]